MGGRGGSSGSKGSGSKGGKKQEFRGSAEVDGFEFRSWSKGDMDRIYYSELSKTKRNGYAPSEGYIDAQTGEIVKQGNNAGVQAAQEFMRRYNYQTQAVKDRMKAKKEVAQKMQSNSTKFNDAHLNIMSRKQLETVASRVIDKMAKARKSSQDEVKRAKAAASKFPDHKLKDFIKKKG